MANEEGIYYFHQGTNYQSYKLLGCHYHDGGATFRVWAPNARNVSVVGDFNRWKRRLGRMKKISREGLWERHIKTVNIYDCYQFAIRAADGRLLYKADPFAFHAEVRPGRASKVYDLSGYEWHDGEWMQNRTLMKNEARPMNIYEMNLGSWRRYHDGTCFDYRKLGEEASDYAVKMGYTHLELMPVSEYPYDPSWGYQVTGYYAITSRYGTPHDFMDFVDCCHQKGIGVILDWVPGHFPKDEHGLIEFDGKTLYECPKWDQMENKGWGTRRFDYGRCEIQSFLCSNAMFFFDMFHIDGLRVDAVASMLYLDYDKKPGEWVPNSFGTNENLEAIAFLKKLNENVHKYYPDVMMIAEESTAFPYITRPVSEGGLGFDYKWNMGWMNDTLEYMKTDPLYRGSIHDKITFQLTYIFSEKFILALSHDEVVHGKRSLLNKMPGEYDRKFAGLRTYMMYMISHPGKKLIFMGAEFGQFIEWNENQELDWLLLGYESHQKMHHFSQALNHLYLKEHAFFDFDDSWDGFRWLVVDDREHNVFAYERKARDGEKIIVILNFSFLDYPKYILNLEPGKYQIILNSEDQVFGGKYTGTRKNYRTDKLNQIKIDLAAISGLYLKKIKEE